MTDLTGMSLLTKFSGINYHPVIFFLIQSRISFREPFIIPPSSIGAPTYFDGRDLID